MITVSEITAAGSAAVSVLTIFLHLWGSKKDRLNGELTAEKLSITAADNVRKDMEQAIQRNTERLETEIRELKSERKEWELERRQLVAALHDFEKRALIAEGKQETAEARLAAMEQRMADLLQLGRNA